MLKSRDRENSPKIKNKTKKKKNNKRKTNKSMFTQFLPQKTEVF